MRICIYGAGAIGGWLGARLAEAGCDVSVIARGETLEVLRRNQLQLRSGTSSMTANVSVAAKPADLGVQDVVIVAVKTTAMRDVALAIGPLLKQDTIVMTAMNGVPWWFFENFGGRHQGLTLDSVDPGAQIASAIPAHHVIGCVVHASCSLDAPGVVRHHFGSRLVLGELTGRATPRLTHLTSLLVEAGFEAVPSMRIQHEVWFKLWGNMTVNPISAISGATTDLLLDDDLVRSFMSRVMCEAKDIGARIGLDIEQAPDDRHEITRKLGKFQTSMLQDVIARKPVELDAMVAAVLEIGGATGTPMPFTEALFGLARLTLRQRGLYRV